MTRKIIFIYFILMLAGAGWSIASGPDTGGGFDSGPGLSGSQERKESEGYPSGAINGSHTQSVTNLPPRMPGRNVSPGPETYPEPQRNPAVPGGRPDRGR